LIFEINPNKHTPALHCSASKAHSPIQTALLWDGLELLGALTKEAKQ